MTQDVGVAATPPLCGPSGGAVASPSPAKPAAANAFTPGPWTIGDVVSGYADIDANAARIPWKQLARVVVKMEGVVGLEDYPQGQANARLIAAAPDLYEQLTALRDAVRRDGDPAYAHLLIDADAALTKAGGSSCAS